VDARVKYAKDLKQTDEEKAQQKLLETMSEADKENAAFDKRKLGVNQADERAAAQEALDALKAKRLAEIKALEEKAAASKAAGFVKAAAADTAALNQAKQAYAQELTQSRVASRNLQEKHSKDTAALDYKHELNIAETKNAAAEAKNAPLSEYAEKLEGQWYLRGAKDAAKKIKDDLNKKQSDKDRDRLQKLLESAADDDEKSKEEK
jgi:hypothetical protein